VLRHKLTLSLDLPHDKDIKGLTVFKKKKKKMKKIEPWHPKVYLAYHCTEGVNIVGWLDI